MFEKNSFQWKYREKDGRICPSYNGESPEFMAITMTDMEILSLMAACGGNPDLLDENLFKAICIAAGMKAEKREMMAEERKKEYHARAAKRHERIVDEIVELMCDAPSFTPMDVQRRAYETGHTVHTRQFYTSHLCIERENRRNNKPARIVSITDDGVSYVEAFTLKGHVVRQPITRSKSTTYKIVKE